MQAIVVREPGGPEVMHLVEMPDPVPGEGEILVETDAIGVNYIDIYRREGRYPQPEPRIPGEEGSGRVVAVGPNALGFKPGDRVVWTTVLFVRVGRGTLAPWDPTATLVVQGPYRHVRNPMISGVLFLLLGEAVLLGSWPLVAWFAAVAAVNAVYLPLVEEPGLVSRYGADYERYREAVPRWVPRLRAWKAAQPPP